MVMALNLFFTNRTRDALTAELARSEAPVPAATIVDEIRAVLETNGGVSGQNSEMQSFQPVRHSLSLTAKLVLFFSDQI